MIKGGPYFSVGPAVAALLGIELAVAGLWRRGPRPLTVAVCAAVALGYVALLVAAPSRDSNPEGPSQDFHAVGKEVPQAEVPDVDPHRTAAATEDVEEPANVGDLAALFETAPDAGARHDLVLRALELEPRCGVHLALRYLEEDPPLFFRQGVIDGVRALRGESLDWNVMQPFSDPSHESSVRRLREGYRLGTPPPPCD